MCKSCSLPKEASVPPSGRDLSQAQAGTGLLLTVRNRTGTTASSLPRAWPCQPKGTSKHRHPGHEGHAARSLPCQFHLGPTEHVACGSRGINRRSLAASVLGPLPPPTVPSPQLSCRCKAAPPGVAVNHSSHNTTPGAGFLRGCSLLSAAAWEGFRRQPVPSSLCLFPALSAFS